MRKFGRAVLLISALLWIAPSALAVIAEVEFLADGEPELRRIAPGETVDFVDESVAFDGFLPTAIVAWQWDLDGDGVIDSTDRNPSFTYADTGAYNVTLTVEDDTGATDTRTKEGLVEVLEPPFADFRMDPWEGDQPLTVFVEDTSRPESGPQQPIAWEWDFGDPGSTDNTSTEPDAAHTYWEPGVYTVTLRVQFDNETGPVDTVSRTVRVGGDRGCGDFIATNFSLEYLIRNEHSLIPLIDWVPLIRITFNHGADEFTYRALANLTLEITGDPADERSYGRMGAPNPSDLLDFAIFRDGALDEPEFGVLDPIYDSIATNAVGEQFVWGAQTGEPLGTLVDTSPITYELDFIDEANGGSPANPRWPIVAQPDDSGQDSWIIAFRTSATWRSMLTLSARVPFATVVDSRGRVLYNEECEEVIDGYSPALQWGDEPEPLETDDLSYSSSFAVWDVTGSLNDPARPDFFNSMVGHAFQYTPWAEWSRPRWDMTGQMLDFARFGDIQVRKLVSLESFYPLIGINIHSTHSVHAADPLRNSSTVSYIPDIDPARSYVALDEVNVIFQDLGADPDGPPGNGGFDPRDGLERFTGTVTWGTNELAIGQDLTFNGVSVWYDSNGNFTFDAPTALPEGGVQMNGDYPMEVTGDVGQWEWIPHPPGGGDPWWKLRMNLTGAHRWEDHPDPWLGEVAPIPNNAAPPDTESASEYSCDYFVVMRADSGYQDASLRNGDGTGFQAGADFKAFIEPRRFNTATGHWDGGIHVSSQIPGLGQSDGEDVSTAWQDDPRWNWPTADDVEPWWPERTLAERNARIQRSTVEVHDLVLTYYGTNEYGYRASLDYRSMAGGGCFGFYQRGAAPTTFDRWLDPHGYLQSEFYNSHSVGAWGWTLDPGSLQLSLTTSVLGLGVSGIGYGGERQIYGHWPYETAPFDMSYYDDTLYGPRSPYYTNPPSVPTFPSLSTWPGNIGPGEYPNIADWSPQYRRARLLKQRIDINSQPTAMLGFNFAGVNDPVTNAKNRMYLTEFHVAFWGPDFTPDDLLPLDREGTDEYSGVAIWDDLDNNGVFGGRPFESFFGDYVTFDQPLPLVDLQWSNQPEPVDITGDGVPDDMNGDGLVDERDYAWVLKITPREHWPLPYEDGGQDGIGQEWIDCGADFGGLKNDRRGYLQSLMDGPQAQDVRPPYKPKAFDPANPVPQLGDDLFLAVRTSDTLTRFEQFRAFVPYGLPNRVGEAKRAGFKFLPRGYADPITVQSHHVEEMGTKNFWGHDMIEANVPTKIVSMVMHNEQIRPNSPATAVLGLDVSTNRENATLDSGEDGVGGTKQFTVSGAAWTPGALVDCFLVDSRYESYQIVGNTATQLTLLSGTPRDGAWRVVKDPTFLEQLIVEFYQEGDTQNFNIMHDLKALDINQRVSGVALYRDNDMDPRNRNGVFDEGIDIPLTLDAEPFLIGASGEPDMQVMFVFSTPGTDDWPIPMEDQPRNRQWVPDTWGRGEGDPFTGPEFFVVIRTSEHLDPYNDFRVGIVSWGPNTPTEPDPDTFVYPEVPANPADEFDIFSEYPWGARGVGYVTVFKDLPMYYHMIDQVAYQKQDNSGFNFIRSSAAKHRRTPVINAREEPLDPYAVHIESASLSQLPTVILPGESLGLVIYGDGFGTQPQVTLLGYTVRVRNATNTRIDLVLTTTDGVVPTEPVVLSVRNPATGGEASRSDLFSLHSGGTSGLRVTRVSPSSGGEAAFPVTVYGTGFATEGMVEVYFGTTKMPLSSASSTQLRVGFPFGGMPATGPLDVKVVNLTAAGEPPAQDILVDGFTYTNSVSGIPGCAGGQLRQPLGAAPWGDILVLLVGLAVLAVLRRARVRD